MTPAAKAGILIDGVKMKEQAKGGGVASRPERYLAFSILLLAMGTTITIVQYKVPSILGPLMENYGMSPQAGSWLMSVFTAVGIFLSIPAGSLAKKAGPKRVLMLGCGVIVLGSVVGALAGSSLVLIASRLVEGIAFVLITVAAPLAIEKYVSPANQDGERHMGTVDLPGLRHRVHGDPRCVRGAGDEGGVASLRSLRCRCRRGPCHAHEGDEARRRRYF